MRNQRDMEADEVCDMAWSVRDKALTVALAFVGFFLIETFLI